MNRPNINKACKAVTNSPPARTPPGEVSNCAPKLVSSNRLASLPPDQEKMWVMTRSSHRTPKRSTASRAGGGKYTRSALGKGAAGGKTLAQPDWGRRIARDL